MTEPDFESAWFALKGHVSSKRSHGADELKTVMHDLEVKYAGSEPDQQDIRPSHSSAA